MTVLCPWLTCHARDNPLHYNIWRRNNHPISRWIVLMKSSHLSNIPAYYERLCCWVRLAEALLSSLLGAYNNPSVDPALKSIEPWVSLGWWGLCSHSALTESLPL